MIYIYETCIQIRIHTVLNFHNIKITFSENGQINDTYISNLKICIHVDLPFKMRAKFSKECQSFEKQSFDNYFDDEKSIWRYD